MEQFNRSAWGRKYSKSKGSYIKVINSIEINIEEKETDINGLKFLPQMSNFNNDADCPAQ